MRKDNLFLFGPQVSGDSFLGRRAEVERVIGALRGSGGNRGAAIIGMNRVGKSSLAARVLEEGFKDCPDVLVVRESLDGYNTPTDFWYDLCLDLLDAISDRGLTDPVLQKYSQRMMAVEPGHPQWLSAVFKRNLYPLLERLKALDIRVVLCLDEFDAARRLFKENPGSLGIVRDLASLSTQSVSVLTVSRRQLFMIEQGATENTSTLNDAFGYKLYLKAFNDSTDMEAYWNALTDYDIFLEPEDEQRLLELTGRQPILLSFYGHAMVEAALAGEEVDGAVIEHIHEEQAPVQLHGIYDRWLERIGEDGCTVPLREIVFGPRMHILPTDEQQLRLLGYLFEEGEGYSIISREFTDYFEQKTRSVRNSEWEALSGAEAVLRRMLKKEYPAMEAIRASQVAADAQNRWTDTCERCCPGISRYVRLDETRRRMLANLHDYRQDSSVIDTLDLSFLVNQILNNWTRFQRHFGGAPLKEWEASLTLLKRVRNPLFHSHADYLTEEERALTVLYCQQITRLGEAL